MEKVNPFDKLQTLAEITALKQQAQTGGNIEDEVNNFNQIIKELSENLITPEKARVRAYSIVNRRYEI